MKRLLKRIFVLTVTLAIIVVPWYLFDFKTLMDNEWSVALFVSYALALPYLFRAFFVFCGLIELEPELEKKTEDTSDDELVTIIKSYSSNERNYSSFPALGGIVNPYKISEMDGASVMHNENRISIIKDYLLKKRRKSSVHYTSKQAKARNSKRYRNY